MKKKKILHSLGVLSCTGVILTSVSCSSSWTKWSKTNEESLPINYNNKITTIKEQYQVRENALGSAFLKDTANDNYIVDLEKINNQYELLYVIQKILKMNIQDPIDEYWNDLTDLDTSNDDRLLNFIKGMTQKSEITFKWEDKTNTIVWDMQKPINKKTVAHTMAAKVDTTNKDDTKVSHKKVSLGITATFEKSFSDMKSLLAQVDDQTSKTYLSIYNEDIQSYQTQKGNGAPFSKISKDISSKKLFDVQKDGLSAAGSPVELSTLTRDVQMVAKFLGLSIVNNLLIKDGNFAFALAKLVNLPAKAFESIYALIENLDVLWNDIYSSLGEWMNRKTLVDENNDILKNKDGIVKIINGVNFSIQTNGAIEASSLYKNHLGQFKGIFLYNVLNKN